MFFKMYNAVVVFTKSKTTEYQIIQTLARGPKKQLHTFVDTENSGIDTLRNLEIINIKFTKKAKSLLILHKVLKVRTKKAKCL